MFLATPDDKAVTNKESKSKPNVLPEMGDVDKNEVSSSTHDEMQSTTSVNEASNEICEDGKQGNGDSQSSNSPNGGGREKSEGNKEKKDESTDESKNGGNNNNNNYNNNDNSGRRNEENNYNSNINDSNDNDEDKNDENKKKEDDENETMETDESNNTQDDKDKNSPNCCLCKKNKTKKKSKTPTRLRKLPIKLKTLDTGRKDLLRAELKVTKAEIDFDLVEQKFRFCNNCFKRLVTRVSELESEMSKNIDMVEIGQEDDDEEYDYDEDNDEDNDDDDNDDNDSDESGVDEESKERDSNFFDTLKLAASDPNNNILFRKEIMTRLMEGNIMGSVSTSSVMSILGARRTGNNELPFRQIADVINEAIKDALNPKNPRAPSPTLSLGSPNSPSSVFASNGSITKGTAINDEGTQPKTHQPIPSIVSFISNMNRKEHEIQNQTEDKPSPFSVISDLIKKQLQQSMPPPPLPKSDKTGKETKRTLGNLVDSIIVKETPTSIDLEIDDPNTRSNFDVSPKSEQFKQDETQIKLENSPLVEQQQKSYLPKNFESPDSSLSYSSPVSVSSPGSDSASPKHKLKEDEKFAPSEIVIDDENSGVDESVPVDKELTVRKEVNTLTSPSAKKPRWSCEDRESPLTTGHLLKSHVLDQDDELGRAKLTSMTRKILSAGFPNEESSKNTLKQDNATKHAVENDSHPLRNRKASLTMQLLQGK